MKDLGNLDKENQSETFLNDLKNVWHIKKYKDKKTCPLFRAIINVNLSRLLFMIILSFIYVVTSLLIIILIREFITQFQEDNGWNDNGHFFKLPIIILGPAILICKIIIIFVWRQILMTHGIIGVKSSIEITSLIYDKILRLGAKSKSEFTEGEITNFIQIDAQTLAEMLTSAPMVLLLPITFSGFFYLLFQYFGISFLYGLGAMLIIFIILGLMQSFYSKLDSQHMKAKDMRMRATYQTFNYLKILKLYGWDDEFLKKINEMRKIENEQFSKILNFQVWYTSLFWSVPLFTAMASIGAYQYEVENMSYSLFFNFFLYARIFMDASIIYHFIDIYFGFTEKNSNFSFLTGN
jgi:ABC-type multidrug transport system fused ATPase/permease subunit